jgi:hypothetical protein
MTWAGRGSNPGPQVPPHHQALYSMFCQVASKYSCTRGHVFDPRLGQVMMALMNTWRKLKLGIQRAYNKVWDEEINRNNNTDQGKLSTYKRFKKLFKHESASSSLVLK